MRLWPLILPLLFMVACFRTRDVEPPASSSSDWISPTDYTILLANMQRALSSGNVPNYIRCFAPDSFRFEPAAPIYAGNQIVWDNWSLQDEQAWLTQVWGNLGITSGNGLSLHEVDLQTFSTDSLRYIGTYSLTMNHTDTSLTVQFVGQLEFLMMLNDYNEWEIRRWTDYETQADSSWSRLKLEYVQ